VPIGIQALRKKSGSEIIFYLAVVLMLKEGYGLVLSGLGNVRRGNFLNS
jgi:hypothetical protein